MKTLFERLFGRRRVEIARTKARSEDELLECFLAAPGNPLWSATMEVIDNHILEEMEHAIGCETPRDRDVSVEAVAALSRLKANLVEMASRAVVGEREQREMERRKA